MAFLQTVIYGNSIQTWIVGLVLALLTFVTLRILVRTAAKRIAILAEKTSTDWDDLIAQVVSRTKILFLLVTAVFVGSLVLTLPAGITRLANGVAVIVVLIQGGIWISGTITFLIGRYTRRQMGDDASSVTTMNALGFVSRLALWTVILLLALDNLGIDVTALVAGLGVGSLAVALAVQNILGDLFASITIVLDKPFVIGDFLAVDDYRGNVEHIGLKTTRMRSLSGEQVVMANADLLGSRIRNYGRLFERRALFTIGVTYDTPRKKLIEIPGIIREAIESQEHTRFERCHFRDFGDFSLNFETAYYVLKPAYSTYMETQQAINLRIHERFEEEGIEFAFPSQTLYLVKQDS
ncbi:MAG: mechanosensitive ion channel family protein [Gemmatimonadales bacterium]